MNEKPLERLNYYNGQRLEASDFKTEQDYHIRTKRWLNKSLYSAGIARGLEVREVPGIPSVMVSPGLALDSEGREIILLEEEQVEVYSYAGTDESTVVGNYLVIEYAEETIAYEKGGCAVRAEGTSANKSITNWGGPSRIQAQVKFSWVSFVPQPGSNQIVLARVELNSTCSEVHQIDAGARRYIGAASAATVRQYALEGERELAFLPKELFPTPKAGEPPNADVAVVGRVYFHIRGRQPNSVVLYLRALDINPLYYTELGRHDHTGPLSGNVGEKELDTRHAHNAKDASGELVTAIEKEETFDYGPNSLPQHAHWLFGRAGNTGALTVGGNRGIGGVNTNAGPQVIGNNIGSDDVGLLQILGGLHRHDVEGTTAVAGYHDTHTHSLDGISAAISATGVDLPARGRSGPSLTFVNDVQISIGPASKTVNCTLNIRQQLADANRANWMDGAGNPKALGDGTGNHVLAMSGTGPIRLDFLPGMTFVEDEYCIELKVDAKTDTGKRVANGGKILYNLYVE